MIGPPKFPLGTVQVAPASSARSAFGLQKTAHEWTHLHLSFPYNLNTDLIGTTTANGGGVSHSTNKLVVTAGEGGTGTATAYSKDAVKYVPGQGVIVRFTAVFSAAAANNVQYVGIGDDTDGFFFGYSGTTFGILHRNNGSDTWIAKADWNNWTFPALDTTKLNVFSISFQWLGAGWIVFSCEDPDTGLPRVVHEIARPNTSSSTSLKNPTLGMWMYAKNDGNTTALTMSVPSFQIAQEAPPNDYGLNGAATAQKGSITTEAAVLTLQNKSTYASATNKIRLHLTGISFATTKDVQIRLRKNATLGGTPSYTDFSTSTSPAAYDTAGTTATGGRVVFALAGEAASAAFVDAAPFAIHLNPGETLTVSAQCSVSSTVTAALTWREEF